MSLIIRDQATDGQLSWLHEHGYYGRTKLTRSEAEQLIDEYIDQEHTILTTRQRGFLEILKQIDPEYLNRYKFIKSLGKE